MNNKYVLPVAIGILLLLKALSEGDATAIALGVGAILVPILAIVFAQFGIGSVEKQWAEFILSIVIAPLALFSVGKLPPFPATFPINDPIALLAALYAYGKLLFGYVAAMATVALALYNYFQTEIRAAKAKRLALFAAK